MPNTTSATAAANVGLDHVERADAVQPHHGRRRVAHHRAGAAAVRGRDDGGEVADMHLALEHAGRHRGADQRRRDVVEETGKDEDDHQQHEGAEPAFGQQPGQHLRHPAVLEVPRQQCEADQQAEQVGQQHPFVRHVRAETGDAGAGLEAGEHDLVGGDRHQAGQRHLQYVVMEQGDAEQRRRKEDEVHRDAEQSGRGGCAISRLRRGRRKQHAGQRQQTARRGKDLFLRCEASISHSHCFCSRIVAACRPSIPAAWWLCRRGFRRMR
jgi:hypothetical protein